MNTAGMLHTISAMTEGPVMWLLLILLAISAIMIGNIIAEAIIRRKNRYSVQEIIRKISESDATELANIIKNTKMTKVQAKALLKITKTSDFSPQMRTEAAQELINSVESHYFKTINFSDLIIKTGPMLGLMGTLIPLGPGIMALGQGDMQTLSNSIITAFDTTVTGLISAGIATVISSIRKIWYKKYIADTESVMECILEKMSMGDAV